MMSNLTREDWNAAYYPTKANTATDTWLEAAKHSLRKWEGVPDEVLEQYGLRRDKHKIRDRDSELDDIWLLALSDDNCALCRRALRDGTADMCAECPLPVVALGCCVEGSPYDYVSCGGSDQHVHDMIADLRKVVTCLEQPEDFFEGEELDEFKARFCDG